tara:strand:- start:293 stop:673 length:381 start_codon:yes stop_codon:yes gene_type:complete
MQLICLFFILVASWTFTTYFIKKDSQKLIREELKNILDISNKFFLSIKNLLRILASDHLTSKSSEISSTESNILDEVDTPLSLVEPGKGIEPQSLEIPLKEDDDTALASFSPEVIAVINEEEEKVA